MPRQQQKKQHLSFVGGLNTESSPLNFPEGTAKDLDNVDLEHDGSVRRRRGIDYELPSSNVGSYTPSLMTRAATSQHKWRSVNGVSGTNFLGVQVGGILRFHRLGRNDLSVADLGQIDFSPLRISDSFENDVIDSVASNGVLFIVSPSISPGYVMYDAGTDMFTLKKLTIKIRDLEGVSEKDDPSGTLAGLSRTPEDGIDPESDINDGTLDMLTSDEVDTLAPISFLPPDFNALEYYGIG